MAEKASIYTRAARWIAQLSGRPATFLLAVGLIVVWLVSGPFFGFSDTWQLVINTGTTIVTFLMVFLIQNTQNRDTVAMQLKLDELIRATKGAHNALLDLEELDEQALEAYRVRFEALARAARQGQLEGRTDTGTPETGTPETGTPETGTPETVSPAAPPAPSAAGPRTASGRGQTARSAKSGSPD